MNDSPNSRLVVEVAGNADGAACVCIAGEVDIAATDALDKALASILDTPRPAVYVDLACVELAGTPLVHFLYRVIGSLPAGTPVMLCRPTFLMGSIIEICLLHTVAAVSAHLPEDFSYRTAPLGSRPAAERVGQLTPSPAHR